MFPNHTFKKRLRNATRTAAYSDQGKNVARVFSNLARSNQKIYDKLSEKNIAQAIERIASEKLPEGYYFAKLTIKNWESFRDQKFRLYQNNKVVYGNQIEPPARGFPLEYRNIIVTSNRTDNFSLSIDAPFTLAISRGAYTTEQQTNYDIKYGVQQHGDVFYSLRGNTINPSKIIVTFPGFGPSTTRISYAVSYLKQLTDHDLKNTLMICFQDRYMVSGSYMRFDSAGRPLYSRVKSVLDNFLSKYNLSDEDLLLFGASKGGSIAIHYAQEYPKAHLLVAVPQMNLPYYTNKPFFRYNLNLVPAIHEIEQAESLLRKYLAENRKIDYFYTNSDELSNFSLIELANGVPNLTKYRVNGKHGEVARTALPAILNVMRQFIGLGKNHEIDCQDSRTFHQEDFIYSQVRIDSSVSAIDGNANWFLQANDGGTIHRVLMSDHSYDFIKFTDYSQKIFPAYDPVENFDKVVGLFDSGESYYGNLPTSISRSEEQSERVITNFDSLNLDTGDEEEKVYTIINGATFGRFKYRSQILNSQGNTAEVHFVDNLKESSFVRPASVQKNPTYSLTVVESLDNFIYAQLFTLRAVTVSGVNRLRIVVHSENVDSDIIKQLVKTDWIQVQVVVVRPVEGLNISRRPFSNWIRKRRLNILKSAQKEISGSNTSGTQPKRRQAITPDQINIQEISNIQEDNSKNYDLQNPSPSPANSPTRNKRKPKSNTKRKANPLSVKRI